MYFISPWNVGLLPEFQPFLFFVHRQGKSNIAELLNMRPFDFCRISKTSYFYELCLNQSRELTKARNRYLNDPPHCNLEDRNPTLNSKSIVSHIPKVSSNPPLLKLFQVTFTLCSSEKGTSMFQSWTSDRLFCYCCSPSSVRNMCCFGKPI